MNIVFTGMRGTGKTTLGKQLAEKIGWDFIDLDEAIETKLNKKIIHFVEEEGWEAFRKIEKEIARETAPLQKTVISTGGGTLIQPENAEILKKNSHVVLLICDLEQLKKYLEASYERPSLGGQKSAIEELEEVWLKRKDHYHRVADTVHDTTNWPPVETLLEKLQNIPGLDL